MLLESSVRPSVFFTDNIPKLRNYLRKHIAIDLIEDAVNDIYLLFIDNVNPNGNLEAYLFVIASNYIHDFRKKHANKGEIEIDVIGDHNESIDFSMILPKIASKTCIFEQTILYLNFFEGYSLTEIAQKLDKPRNLVHGKHQRAIKRIRKCI